ncbi:MAG: class I SAM-dependent methyltransferase, partial [Chloroflexi bacterium]|nr:class I SAM-dependent methyltransferase [Chloroflexota bacterium]
SSMNIANKQALYAEIRRVIRPAGRFAFHEIIAGPSQPIYFPVPWARGPEISFLSPAFEVRALLEEAGFREKKWVDISAASRVWWQQRLGAIARRVAPEPIGLHLLLGPDIQAMGQNILRNLNENRIQVVQGVFERVD